VSSATQWRSAAVIGQTVEIGDDPSILQGVVLGSTGIAGNSAGRRHPTLGDRVEVGAFVRVLGPVTIGADTMIGADCVVTTDVPAGTRAVVRSQHQILSSGCRLQVFGTVPRLDGGFEVHGSGLSEVGITVVDRQLCPLDQPRVVIERGTDRLLQCSLGPLLGEARAPREVALLLVDRSGEWLAIMKPVVLRPPPVSYDEARSA